MTTIDKIPSDKIPTPEDFAKASYSAYNAEGTIAVRCGRDGEITGIKIAPEAMKRGEKWIAAEVTRVADMAFQKSMHGIRQEMEAAALTEGRSTAEVGVLAREMKLPTADDIQNIEEGEQARLHTPT